MGFIFVSWHCEFFLGHWGISPVRNLVCFLWQRLALWFPSAASFILICQMEVFYHGIFKWKFFFVMAHLNRSYFICHSNGI